jgi:hypothetical protein
MITAEQDELVRTLIELILRAPAGDPGADRAAALIGLTPRGASRDLDARLRIALGMAPAEPLNRSGNVRGFTTYDKFTDTYGSSVRVHQSSAAAGPHCWIFCTAGHPADQATAPHLDVAQARRVRHALGAFIAEHGEPL